MSDTPRLTIGIPTVDRPEHLQYAIDSCLAQTVPVKVIIADQGGTEGTGRVMDRYADHPHVRHRLTHAANLWQNWRDPAQACETEFFAWLQDDDIVSRIFASRVIQAFDSYPQALHWQANCHCSPDRVHALKWGWNGPQIGVRMIDTATEQWPGGILLASMYLTSWALSPGVAFRCGFEFDAAVDGMPEGCDLFAERLILAAMGAQGPWVADPVTAGYWHHHGGNESYAQNASGDLPRQRAIMVEHLDDILDRAKGWQEAFFVWLRTRNPEEVLKWAVKFECKKSRHAETLIATMRDSVKDRLEVKVKPKQKRGPARARGRKSIDPVPACA